MGEEEIKLNRIKKWLIPFSWIYIFFVGIRNLMFKIGILKRREYNIPIICIGNLTSGGTGKTPHTEYVAKLLSSKYRVAILSRGYKRKKRGFILAETSHSPREIGDEAYQMKQKFADIPNIMIAVDANRNRGITKLLQFKEPPQVVILDDGFQHRYVLPSYVVLLNDFHRPIYEDEFLPAGRLREPISYKDDASDIIVTKCPHNVPPIEFNIIRHELSPYPYQGLYFTTFIYLNLMPVFDKSLPAIKLEELTEYDIFLITGIGNANPLLHHVKEYTKNVEHFDFSDHHQFTEKEIDNISKKFANNENENKLILTTEKDATRLIQFDNLEKNIQDNIYYIPIEVSFMKRDSQEEFDKKILRHVKEYSDNSRLYKK